MDHNIKMIYNIMYSSRNFLTQSLEEHKVNMECGEDGMWVRFVSTTNSSVIALKLKERK